MVGTSFKGWCSYFQYNEDSKDEDKQRNKDEARNALLVVATLIAAVTFQAGVNPPGGVWDETKTGQKAGTSIIATESKEGYYVFLTANTLAFSSAVLVIMSLTHKFPFRFELRVASISMIITYGASVFSVTNNMSFFRFILIVAAAPLVMRCLIQLFVELRNSKEAESSCLIQAFARPKNKTTDREPSDLGDRS